MKSHKVAFKDSKLINLGTKKIHSFPLQTRMMSVAYMQIQGRHPEGKGFLLEHDCQFVIYVTKGKAKIFAGDQIFEVKVGDVVFVPTETKFAVEGDVEYVTVDTPGFYPEQSEETKE
jgi:mannose-6-phosphate isomerase-like protein (cupin superfamily)